MKMQIPTIAATFEPNMDGFRYHGVRVERQVRQIGEVLANSWHPASECDWLEEDTELDGTCCFEVQGSVASALRLAHSYWPDATRFTLIGADYSGDASPAGGLPEDGAMLLNAPTVLAYFEA